MKEIFDWLREQIRKESWLCKPRTKGHYSDDAVFVEDAMNIITEAEAKWEEDCCEWSKPSKEHGFIKNPHTGRIFSNEPSMQNVYCNTCGKPIKIAEVE